MSSVPVIAVRLVREGSLSYDASRSRPTVRIAADAALILGTLLADYDREAFVVLCLDVRHRVIGAHIAHLGMLDSTNVHAREVFKAAILANAAAVICGHNHPSGEPEPSGDDLRIHAKLSDAGTILGIPVLDHIILGSEHRFISLRERGGR